MFAIYNPRTKKFATHYNSNHMPAIYQSRGVAEVIRALRLKSRAVEDCCVVVKVEVKIV